MFDIEPLTGSLGAEIQGLDMAVVPDAEVVSKLRAAMAEYKVLVVRDQHTVGPREHLAFASQFGTAEVHPQHPHLDDLPAVTILEKLGDHGYERDSWHTDGSPRNNTTWFSFLRAVSIPPYGRDTLFADMEAAYRGLSPGLQSYIDPLTALHSWGRQIPDAAPVQHPVVLTSSLTGRKVLYVNRVYTRLVEGMREMESDSLLTYLCEQAHIPEYQLRVRWRPGSIAMWDNETTQHYLVRDVEFPRVMHRVMVTPEPM
jgi:taurine dioxygenase